MGDIEWVGSPGSWPSESVAGEPIGRLTVDIEQARALTLAPDEVLVVVFPSWVGQHNLDAHTTRLRGVLGNRFIAVMGDNVQLAKVRTEDWA